ncbi:HAD family hydrolase [Dermabacteraceae bacterium P13103]
MNKTIRETFAGFTPGAALLDCDGLLVNTEQIWHESQDKLLARYGGQIDAPTRAGLVGKAPELVLPVLAAATGLDPQRCQEELIAQHVADVRANLALLPGAAETVRALAARVPVAVVSNSPREFLLGKLEKTGLHEYVTATVGLEDVAAGKPAPDMYLRGAELLGVAPEKAIAFEDSETGACAARTAGVRLIAVPSVPGQCPQADHTLESLADKELHEWIAEWEQQ